MAIVKMKKLKLMVASSQREELLRELMLLGCVEVSHLPQPEDGENAFLSRAEVPDQTRRRTEQALLANSISVLKKYAPEKGGMGAMLSPLPDVFAKPSAGKNHSNRADSNTITNKNGSHRRKMFVFCLIVVTRSKS